MMEKAMDVYQTRLKTGITRSPEFERKKLASHAVNVGLKCGHCCTYCSSGAMLRTHPIFREIGRSPFEHGYAIVDPDTPGRVARDARRLRRRGMIQLCTTVDAWSPEAQQYNLGRRCLEAILAEPEWTVRILTKNVAVMRDFELIERYRDRVLVGLSLTATPDKAHIMSAVEPHASPIPERVAALRAAHARGLRTYAMFCPLLPGIADSASDIDTLVHFAEECGVEEIFAEPVNPRGNGLKLTQQALESMGFDKQAAAVGRIRRQADWSRYVVDMIHNVQRGVRSFSDIRKLRVLLYHANLTREDEESIRHNDAGVIWLGKRANANSEPVHADDQDL